MEKIIELKSNKEEHNYLKRLERVDEGDSLTYLLHTSFIPVQATVTANKAQLKPRGSHTITECELLEEANAVVKKIIFTHKGWIIIFKSSEETEKGGIK